MSLYDYNSLLTDLVAKPQNLFDCSWPSWSWCCRASAVMSWRVSYQGVAQVPEDINTTDQEVVVDLVILVSGVAAAVVILASAVIGEDQAKLTVHPAVIPLVDQVQADSEDNRRIDIRNSARVAAVVIKTVVPEDSKEDMADVTAEG